MNQFYLTCNHFSYITNNPDHEHTHIHVQYERINYDYIFLVKSLETIPSSH